MVTTPLTGDVPPSSMPNSAPYSRQGLHRNKSGLGHAASNGFVKWTALTQPNYAAVLHGINDMRYEEFPLASTLKEGTVRIEVKAVGICGSDVHYWKRVRLGHQQYCREPKSMMTDRRIPVRREELRTSWSKSLWSSGTSQQGEPANFAFKATARQSERRSGSVCF